jgi:hypothetical protein
MKRKIRSKKNEPRGQLSGWRKEKGRKEKML